MSENPDQAAAVQCPSGNAYHVWHILNDVSGMFFGRARPS